MEISKPFAGLKVIELATVLAGPATGMFFAELGATVIKIENPLTNGDVTRQWKSANEDKNQKTSAYYHSVNWGKEILFADISTDAGAEKLAELLSDADILIVNFKSGDAEKFHLGFQSLSEKFPRLIYAHLSGYGENDPRPAFDLVMQAETGFMSMNGTSESGPLKMPVAMIDLMAAHQLKEGILTSLFVRQKTGKGSKVSVSLYDAAISSLANQASNFLCANFTAGLNGSLHPNIAPYGETFLCKDGRYIVLAIGNDNQFRKFCDAFNLKEISESEKFKTNPSRIVFRNELFEILRPAFSKLSSTEIIALLNNLVPFALIKHIDEVLTSESGKKMILNNQCVKTASFVISD